MRGAFVCAFALVFASLAHAAEPKPEPCRLLTLDDVQGVMGAGFHQLPSVPNGTICFYQKESATAGLRYFVIDSEAAVQLGKMRQDLKKTLPVVGLGDGAFSRVLGSNIALYFGKGNFVVSLEVSYDNKPGMEQAQKLAKVVLARLP
jgi:hypothetical protein